MTYTTDSQGYWNRRRVARAIAEHEGELGVTVSELVELLERAGWPLSRQCIRDHVNALFADGHALRGHAPGGGNTYRWRLTPTGRDRYGEHPS